MIQLPKEFKENIINRHGKIGKEWLNSTNEIIEKYKKQFNLSNIKLADNLSMNILIYANSSEYGEVVLKIGAPGETTIGEINYLRQYSSKYFAKCYYYNIDDRVMLLEKVNPGYNLMNIKNQQERINIFCTMLNNIIVNNTSNNEFKFYENIIKEKIEYVNNNKQDYTNILHMSDITNNLYNDIKKLNLPKYILHDDLQYKNIIKSNQGWKVIDPHGVIGEKVFETTHFIRNELLENGLERMDEIVALISNYLKEEKILIYKALYIITFCKIVYYIKAKYDSNFIFCNINICEKILEYISKLDKNR